MPDVDLSDLVGSPKLVTITSKSGRTFKVNAQYADRFRGLIDDLEAGGYNVGTVQGYNDRDIAGTHHLSQHALGEAIDINPGQNARGTRGNIPESLANALAKKHGLVWGGDWKNPDPMHFEIPAQGAPEVAGGAPPKAADADVDLSDLADKPAPPKPTPLKKATLADQAMEVVKAQARNAADLAHSTLEGHRAAVRQAETDVTTPEFKRPIGEQVADAMFPQARPAMDLMGVLGGGALGGFAKGVAAPITNTLRDVTSGKVNLDPQWVGDVASLLIPGLGEVADTARLGSRARAAGVSAEALRANEAARVRANTLRAPAAPARPPAGVPSPYYKGMPDAAFNRAAYDDTLREIGVSYPKDGPVGNDGVAKVGKIVSDGYEAVKPRIRMKDDTALTDAMAARRAAAEKIGTPQGQRFETILNNDVLHHIQHGGMDGRTFIRVRSDLRATARSLASDAARTGDRNQAQLAKEVRGLADDMTAAMERSSPKAAVEQIRKLDRANVKLEHLRGAAARNSVNRGVFTPANMAAESKQEAGELATSEGRGVFQKEAQTAYRKKPSFSQRAVGAGVGALAGAHIPLVGPFVGADIGATVGAMLPDAGQAARLSRNALLRLYRNEAARHAANPRNYLKSIDQRVLGAPAVSALRPQQ